VPFRILVRVTLMALSWYPVLQLRRYSCLHDKLTTFFLLASAKGGSDKLTHVLELTNNGQSATIMKGKGKNTYTGGIMKDEHQEKILENLDRLCSHTVNVPLVFTFSMGLGLISGRDKEMLVSSNSLYQLQCARTDKKERKMDLDL